MRVLQVLPELNVGGVETGTVDFAQYLVKHGHKSYVISNGGMLVAKLKNSGTKHFKLAVHKKSLFSVINLIKKVRRIIQDEKIDIVHARSRIPGWIAYFACRKTNASFVTTCHGHYKNVFYSQVMGKSKLVIVPSEATARYMIDHFGTDPEVIRCIPRSVNLDRFNIVKQKNTGANIVISVLGRITPLKGHKHFLQAMAKVARNYPHATIQIIGDAPRKKQFYKDELMSLARRLGIESNVHFLGNRQDIPEL
ncbi:MAG: glycosyltransferase involved in cell wall biosynthesis, partial [Candidatus Omnitrophota bacterium]